MAKSEVACAYCNKKFLKDNGEIKRSKNHFCSQECYRLNKKRETMNDVIGKKYNDLTIITCEYREDGRLYSKCLCTCGRIREKRFDSVMSGKSAKCGSCNGDGLEKFFSYVNIIDKNTWLWTGGKNEYGYPVFCIDGKAVLAHRYIYDALIEPIGKDLCCCHRDDNRSNVSPYNIFVGTKNDNNQDMFKKGRHCTGEDHPFAVLSDAKILEIRSLREKENYTFEKLATISGVSISYIGRIIRKERRKYTSC